MRVACDVETNGLYDVVGVTEPDTVHCIVCVDLDTGDRYEFGPDNLNEFARFASGVAHWVGHNFLLYDRRVLKDILGVHINSRNISDTLILSRLFDPLRDGGHSIKRWGVFFKVFKVEHEDWTTFSPEMLQRCNVDVDILVKTYHHLLEEGKDFSQKCIRLEHNVVLLLEEAKQRGWKLDVEKATKLYTKISAEIQELANSFDSEEWPVLLYPNRLVKYRCKQDGSPYSYTTKPLSERDREGLVGDYTLIKRKRFDPNSTSLIRDYMRFFGWNPTDFTKAGNPTVSEENLDTLPDDAPKAAFDVKKYLVLNSRTKTIQNWLDNTGPDERVHGTIIHIGARTHRCSHRDPNTANIPKAKAKIPYGIECRECWTVDGDDRRLVGADASGIQLRVLAHLANDPEFTERVLAKEPHDVHTHHQHILGVDDRDTSKTFIYAWLLGSGNEKTGRILGTNTEGGKKAKATFLEANPHLKKVRQMCRVWAQRGYYVARDGRRVNVPSEHFALSVALQSEEAVIMKQAGILWKQQVTKEELDAFIVGFIHDEYQMDSHLTCADRCGTILVDSIRRAGEILQYRIRLDGEYKIGTTWADTH